MNNNYEVIKNIEKIKKGNATKFIDGNMKSILKNKLSKTEYNVYYPYPESEKVIFYKDIKPNVSLFEIDTKDTLEHRKILGSIFALGIDSSVFGDIVKYNNKYYVYVLDSIKDYFISNFINVGKSKIKLIEKDIDFLINYKREYQVIDIISSSERIDTVISHLLNTNRNKVKELIKDKDIILNYNILTNYSKKLINGDIFSIRKHGKYKYIGIEKNTKNGNFIIKINKYI